MGVEVRAMVLLLLTILKAQGRKLLGVRLPPVPFLKGKSYVTVTVNISKHRRQKDQGDLQFSEGPEVSYEHLDFRA